MSSMNELIKADGQLDIVVTGPDGQVKQNVHVPNTVMTLGKNFIAQRLVDTGSPTQMTHMAIGTVATNPADPAQTALGDQAAIVALVGLEGSVATNVVTYTASFAAGVGTGALVEAGIFNAAAAGTMLCRTTFSVINKGVDDTLTITWTVTIN